MAGKYVPSKSSNDKYHFNLKAVNEQIMRSSEMYLCKPAMESGIESVKNNGPIAGADDQTG